MSIVLADSSSQCSDADRVDAYSAGLREVLDRHAPLVTHCISQRRSAPWLTEGVREELHAEGDVRQRRAAPWLTEGVRETLHAEASDVQPRG